MNIMSRRSSSRKRKKQTKRESYLEYKAHVNKRESKEWKPRVIKIFDNAKLQWYKQKGHELNFKDEIDLTKMTRFGKSAKHANCIEVFVKGTFGSIKHKFQFDDLNNYVTFMKYLDKFSLVNFANQNKGIRKKDSIESVSVLSICINSPLHSLYACNHKLYTKFLNRSVMQQENTTIDDLQKARLYMTECPKNGKISSDFKFPEC